MSFQLSGPGKAITFFTESDSVYHRKYKIHLIAEKITNLFNVFSLYRNATAECHATNEEDIKERRQENDPHHCSQKEAHLYRALHPRG